MIKYPKRGATFLRRRVNVPTMGNNLKHLREREGWTIEVAATHFGLSRSGYQKLERNERRLTNQYIAKAANVYGVPESIVIAEQVRVRLVGFVGAGHEMHLYADGDDLAEDVQSPPDVTASTVAVRVKGDSMADHIEDGSILYYDDRRDPPSDDLIGRLCVVELRDGRVLVKKLAKGSAAGLWHLLSTNAAPMFDQPVSWAARVTWIRPG